MTTESEQFWDDNHYRFGLAGEGQADIIQSYLERKPGSVLNIGCGPLGNKIKNLAGYCKRLIAADKSLDGLRTARSEITWPYSLRRIAFLVADAESLPIESSSIDYVVALGLFADIAYANPATILSEFYRICRQKGYAMITNAVAHPIEKYRELGTKAGFQLIYKACGYCPAASGSVKERYLLVFTKP